MKFINSVNIYWVPTMYKDVLNLKYYTFKCYSKYLGLGPAKGWSQIEKALEPLTITLCKSDNSGDLGAANSGIVYQDDYWYGAGGWRAKTLGWEERDFLVSHYLWNKDHYGEETNNCESFMQ